MIRLILISSLVVFFVPSLAAAGEFEECEIELHDDGFTEVEYEDDVTGVECTAIIPPGATPTAADQACLDLCEGLLAISPEAVPPFLKSLPGVLNRVTMSQLETWFQCGMELLKENPERGIAFFKVESNTSESLL